MIRFFRTNRQKLLDKNKFRKYLLYAIGEIILVVIGILIAVQIDNWNDRQQILFQERELLNSVLENIKTDSSSIDSVIFAANTILVIYENLIKYSNQEIDKNEVGNIDLVRRSEPNKLITQKNHPNLPNQVLDLELKKVILDFYLEIEQFEKTRIDYNHIIEQYIRPLMAEKNLLNYQAQISLPKIPVDLVNESKFFEALEEDELKQNLFESRLKLSILKMFAIKLSQKNNVAKEAILHYLNKQ